MGASRRNFSKTLTNNKKQMKPTWCVAFRRTGAASSTRLDVVYTYTPSSTSRRRRGRRRRAPSDADRRRGEVLHVHAETSRGRKFRDGRADVPPRQGRSRRLRRCTNRMDVVDLGLCERMMRAEWGQRQHVRIIERAGAVLWLKSFETLASTKHQTFVFWQYRS